MMAEYTMLFLHPIAQFISTIVAIYVIYTGMQRFRMLHLHKRVTFHWKRHVSLGMVVLLLWVIGLVGGFMVTRSVWYTTFITGLHARIAVVMGPMIGIGFATGFYMNRIKKKRILLPLIHGANNTILFLLAVYQISSGWQVLQKFVLEST